MSATAESLIQRHLLPPEPIGSRLKAATALVEGIQYFHSILAGNVKTEFRLFVESCNNQPIIMEGITVTTKKTIVRSFIAYQLLQSGFLISNSGLLQKAALALTSIYDAASDPMLWDRALDHCVDAVGARSSNLMFHETDRDSRWRFALGSKVWRDLSADTMSQVTEYFKKYDESAWQFIYSHPKRTVICDTDFWADVNNLESRDDYRFFEKEVGFVRRVGSTLNDHACWRDNISFQFAKSHRVVPTQSIESMRFLLPHAAKSVEMWRTFSLLKSRYNAVLSALDFVDVGLVVCDANGTVIVSNNEAKRIFDDRDGLWLGANNRLQLKDKDAHAAVTHAIEKISLTAGGESTISEYLHAISRSGTEHPLLIELSPLRDSANEIERNLGGAMITLIDPMTPVEFDTTRMAEAYQLTTAESEVCKLIVDGRTSQSIADERNVRLDTIKSQLKSILHKTKTNRRSELIRLALKATPPVR